MNEMVILSAESYKDLIRTIEELNNDSKLLYGYLKRLKPEIMEHDLYSFYLKEHNYEDVNDLVKKFPFSKPLVWYLYNGFTKYELLEFVQMKAKELAEKEAEENEGEEQ